MKDLTYSEIITIWKTKNIVTTEELNQTLTDFKITFAYNSAAIENPRITYLDTKQIFENRKMIYTAYDMQTRCEIQNQKKCYEALASKIIARERITPKLIKEIHLLLMKDAYDADCRNRGEKPGTYKIHDYVIGNSEQGALPEEVPAEIEELCEEMEGISDNGDNRIKAAAYLHCKFENIHPFADGNGRVGRTLMNYYLLTHEYPPVVIYNDTKDKYYKALDNYDRTGEIQPFVNHIKECMERTWKNLI